MCGIAGVVSEAPNTKIPEMLSAMDKALRHRGPDGNGFLGWSRDTGLKVTSNAQALAACQFGFAHQRLAIIDVGNSGSQPMVSGNGDYAITYNGEVYNYIELREELEREGVVFKTHSDTEVVLEAWSQWGPACLTKFVGMFAFAISDLRNRRIHLARDPFGIKPLYLAKVPSQGVAFASEIPALLELGDVRRQVNNNALVRYLASGRTDCNAETFFSSIDAVPPATVVTISHGDDLSITSRRYWNLAVQTNRQIRSEEAASELRRLFVKNVDLHLRSDVPVGAALSGGIDSSSIVATMRHLHPSDIEIHAFNFASSDEATNEAGYARLVAEQNSVLLHTTDGNEDLLDEELDRLIRVQGEPFASTSIQAQAAVFRLAQQNGIKVTLDGQGADEYLAGYPVFRAARIADLLRQGRISTAASIGRNCSRFELLRAFSFFLPKPIRETMRRNRAGGAWLDALPASREGCILDDKEHVANRGVLHSTLEEALLQDSLPALLRYNDRNSMAASVESRVPFLTTEIVEFALSLPEHLLMDDKGISKSIFRTALKGITPPEILDRKDKIGFVTPQDKWLMKAGNWVDAVERGEAYSMLPIRNKDRLNNAPPALKWRLLNAARWAELYGVEFTF